MKTDSIGNILARLGLPERAVSIGKPVVEECYVIAQEGAEWTVYYAERGHRNSEQRFSSETIASRYLIGWLIDSVLQWR